MMSSRGRGGGNGGRGGGRRPQRKKTFKNNVKGERNKPKKKKKPPRGNGNNESGLGFVLFAFVATASVAFARALFRAKKQDDAFRLEQENIRERLKSKPLSVTDHGACRMDCRFISQSDVKTALAKGSLSKKHSTFPERKFAFENGRVRAIFGENKDATTVVTVIDVDTDHPCGPC